MDLLDFKNEMLEIVRFNSVAELTSDKEEFIKFVSETLIEAEEIEEFNYLPFEGLGKKGRKIQIDGYEYNELDNYLSIFVSPALTYSNDETLTNSDAEKDTE